MTLNRLLFLVLAAIVGGLGAAPASAASLLGVRFGVHSQTETRIVIDLAGDATYILSGDGEGAGRIIVDLTGVEVGAAYRVRTPAGGQVADYQIRSVANGRERVVFSLASTAAVKGHFIIPAAGPGAKTRLVVDLVEADKAALLASLPSRYQDLAPVIQAATQTPTAQPVAGGARTQSAAPPPPAPIPTSTPPIATASPWGERPAPSAAGGTSGAAPAPAAASAAVQSVGAARPITIVIDAGHGGGDPGATGASGTLEKNVTLAAANELATQLRAKGRYTVVLTRATDRRLHLDERSQLAREAGAELFISLHADAHADATVRGGSVYTLSDKGTVRAANEVRSKSDYEIYGERMAERPGDVSSTLIDLAQRHTRNESARFAALLLEKLRSATPLLKTANRREDLYVLLSPDVPAVLFELAFMSNEADEKNLNSPAWRKRAMRAVASSIDAYFDTKDQAGATTASAAQPAP